MLLIFDKRNIVIALQLKKKGGGGLIDAAADSEYGVLTSCDIGAKPIERSELECLMWWIALRGHTFKIEYKF
jgi:hypothetical protein